MPAGLPMFTSKLGRTSLSRFPGSESGAERRDAPRLLVTRLAFSYDEQIATAKRELVSVQTQRSDFQEWLERPFLRASYCDELTALRDRLKLALDGTRPHS